MMARMQTTCAAGLSSCPHLMYRQMRGALPSEHSGVHKQQPSLALQQGRWLWRVSVTRQPQDRLEDADYPCSGVPWCVCSRSEGLSLGWRRARDPANARSCVWSLPPHYSNCSIRPNRPEHYVASLRVRHRRDDALERQALRDLVPFRPQRRCWHWSLHAGRGYDMDSGWLGRFRH